MHVQEQSDTIAKVVKSVYVATDQSYANLVAEDTLTFVKFFAPWWLVLGIMQHAPSLPFCFSCAACVQVRACR